MADFVSKGVVKSAERKLTTPISNVTDFLALVQDVIENNPSGYVSYTSSKKPLPGFFVDLSPIQERLCMRMPSPRLLGRFQ